MDTDTVKMLASFIAKKIMVSLCGALITLGALQSGDQATSFETIGSGILVGLAGVTWSWWNDRGKQIVLAQIAKAHGVVPKSASVVTAANAIQATVKTADAVPGAQP